MRYEFIQAEKANYPVTIMCRCLMVSRSGFYAWFARPEPARRTADKELVDTIKDILTEVLEHEKEGLAVLHRVLPLVEGKYLALEEFVRTMVVDEEMHVSEVEKILPYGPAQRLAVCRNGKRACPPEGVGGVWGYEIFLEAINDPEHPEHEMYLEWIDDDFDPEEYDLEGTNKALKKLS